MEIIQKEKHTIEWVTENWKCLSKYCIDKGISRTQIINKIVSNFLSTQDVKDEILKFREDQAKAISKRNVV